jgi:hypothetical protein
MNIYLEPPACASEIVTDAASAAAQSWRASIKVHPAAEMFPLMDKVELAALAEDIKTRGLVSPLVLWLAGKDAQAQLLDGRNRLDAFELALGRSVRVVSRTYRGRATWSLETDDVDGEPVLVADMIDAGALEQNIVVLGPRTDPYAYVTSTNLHRRHLTTKQKRELIAELLKVGPSRSNNATAKLAQVDDKTVAAVRAELEGRSEIPNAKIRTDSKGREQPARKERKRNTAKVQEADAAPVELTETLVDATVAPTPVARDDIGPNSVGEVTREHTARRLEIANLGLQSEVDELRAAATTVDSDAMQRELSKLSVEGLLQVLPNSIKNDLKRRVVEHLSAPDLLAALERRLPGAPPSAKVRAALKVLEAAFEE